MGDDFVFPGQSWPVAPYQVMGQHGQISLILDAQGAYYVYTPEQLAELAEFERQQTAEAAYERIFLP